MGSGQVGLHPDGLVVKVVEPAAQGGDFFVAYDRGALVPKEEANEPGREVDRLASLRFKVNEDVAAEQGLVDPLGAVAPAALDALRGAVDLKALGGELVGEFFFPAGLGVDHEPSLSAWGAGAWDRWFWIRHGADSGLDAV